MGVRKAPGARWQRMGVPRPPPARVPPPPPARRRPRLLIGRSARRLPRACCPRPRAGAIPRQHVHDLCRVCRSVALPAGSAGGYRRRPSRAWHSLLSALHCPCARQRPLLSSSTPSTALQPGESSAPHALQTSRSRLCTPAREGRAQAVAQGLGGQQQDRGVYYRGWCEAPPQPSSFTSTASSSTSAAPALPPPLLGWCPALAGVLAGLLGVLLLCGTVLSGKRQVEALAHVARLPASGGSASTGSVLPFAPQKVACQPRARATLKSA